MAKLTKTGKISVLVLIIVALLGVKFWYDKKNDIDTFAIFSGGSGQTYNVGVVTWGGYAGGEYFNGGFEASEESRFYKDYGFKVNFVLIDDFEASRAAFKAGEIDLLWQTADAFPTEAEGLSSLNPKILFQSDWSRGGDAIVARLGINSVNDLRGKKVAAAPMTPSHTFLLNMLSSSGMTMKDIEFVEVANAIDAADLFKKNRVDAAVVWSPDDQDCIANVQGSKILLNTKSAGNIIADIFFAKEDFIKKHEKDMANLIEGWMIGAAEINSDPNAKNKAAEILAAGLNQPKDFCLAAIENARLCTYGDNLNFFGLNRDFKGVNGDDLYSRMTSIYADAGFANETKTPKWREVTDISFLESLKESEKLKGMKHDAEKVATFAAATEKDKTAKAVATKKVTISFPTNGSTLDDNARYIIDKEFIDIAKGFSNMKIRIEGNTDNTGNDEINSRISEARAKAVENYLVNERGFDRNRIISKGNGSHKPVADNSTPDGRAANRRTDFELIP